MTINAGAEINLAANGTGNAFTGNLLITTNETGSDIDAHVTIDGGTTDLKIGLSTIEGNLTLLSGGEITDDGIATVKGTLTATTDASASAITLNQLAVDGAFTLAPDGTGAVTIVNDVNLNLAASTMGGTFSGTATTGDISDSGNLAITGAATFITTANNRSIILDQSGNAFTSTVTMQAGDGSATFNNITFVDSAAVRLNSSAASAGDLYINASTDLAVGGNLSITATTGDITQGAALAITGASTFITTANNRSIILNQSGNAFTSTVTMQAGNGSNATFDNITFVDSADVRLHSSAASAGDLYINASTDLAVGGNLSITATTGDITQGAALAITGASTFITTANNRSIILDQSGNAFTSTVTMQAGDGSAAFNNITFVDSADVRLHSSAASAGDLYINASTDLAVGGNLSITATTGNITQGSEIDVGTTATFTTSASNGTITLNDADNTFTGAVALNTNGSSGNATIKNDRALLLAASSVGGAFSATATAGNITQNGALDIEGVTTLVTSGQGADIVLTTDTNAFTSQLLITTNETGSDIDAHVTIDGGTTDLKIGLSTIEGNLTLLSGGEITDDGIATVKGTLTATTDASASAITLNQLAVDGAFTLAPDGTGAVTIVNDVNLNLAASTMGGTFSGTATTGDISDSGNLAITGAATFITTANNRSIILDQSGNAFTSTVTMQAGDGSATFNNITFVDSAAVRLNSSAASAGDLYINASTDLAVGGNLSITATTGDITQGGALTITGTTTLVTLGQGADMDLAANGTGNAFTGKLLITTNETSSNSKDAHVTIDGGTTNLILGLSTIEGNLTLLSGGEITDAVGETVTIRGTISATTDANDSDITLDSLEVGGISLLVPNGTGAVTIVNANGIDFVAMTVRGNLIATATTGNITQSGALTITGTSTIVTSADNATITLNDGGNTFTGKLLITTNDTGVETDGDVAIDGGTTNLILGASTIEGDLALRSGGEITDDGIATVKGTLTATTDASNRLITLNQLAVTGAVTLAPDGTGAVTIVNAAGLNLAASTMGGTFSGTATTGNITQSGALAIAGATTLVTSGQGADIVLTTDTNAFTSHLLITTNETGSDIDADVSIDGGTTNLIIGTSTIDGNLTLRSGGTITDTGSSTVTVKGTLTATTDQLNKIITLNDLAVDGAFTLAPDGTGAVTIVNDAGLILAASTMGGTFSGTATTGNITQTGALDIEGAITLVTLGQGATIDLLTNGSGNAFTSQLLITTNETGSDIDADVSIDGGTTNLIIGTSTIDGNLTLRSGGTITDTDGSTVTVKGTLSATTDASNRIITLNDLVVTGAFTLAPHGTGAVTIVNAAGLNLAASTMGGTFSGTATTGDISDSGNLAITGAATFITTANNRSIILDQSGNAFTSNVTMQAGDGSAAFNNITFVDSADVRLHSSAASAGDLFINAGTDLDVDGSLNITATTGNITQGSELDVGTTATFTTSASNGTITLNDADNTFTGAVALNTNGSSGNATIKNDRALLLAASSVGGAFSATATAGNITQNGALDIEGVTTLVTSAQLATIDLLTNGSGNAFTSQLLITTNDNSSPYTANVSIDGGTTNLIIGLSTIDGNLTLLSGGEITDDGIATVKGTLTATTDASASAITLNQLAVDGAFILDPDGTGAVTIVNDVNLNLAASTMGGTFSGTATTGDISDSGNLAITGAATFITTQAAQRYYS